MKPAGSLNDPQSRDDAPPPPIKSNRKRVIVLAVAGAMVAIVLIAVAFKIDRSAQQPRRENPNVVELVPPENLDPAAAGGDFKRITTNLSELGAENTWIQTTREGKLAQQYRFASHDPNPQGLPPGWSKVIRPEIQIYMDDDRVLTLQSQTALLRATSHNLESGTMTDDVVIRLYELDEGQSFSSNDTPVMEAKTGEASFDSVQGEIRCDGAIDIQTPTAHLPGSGLRVQINEVANRIQWMRMEHVETIRLSAIEQEDSNSRRPRASQQNQRAGNREGGRSRDATQARPKPPAPTFYRLTLQENVHARQRGERVEWTANGDNLHITFSLKGGVLNPTAANQSAGSAILSAGVHGALISIAVALPQSAATATPLFTPSDDDIIVTCSKGMTMTPLSDGDVKPQSPDEALMELVGAPAHLRSVSDSIDVKCQSLSYLTKQQRIVVRGTTATPARLDAPEAEGEFTEFWLNRLKNVGGFVGAGWMILRERSDPIPVQPHEKDLRIQWLDRVDLSFFKEAAQDDRRASIGQLKRAAFTGKVNVLSEELAMDADEMTVTLPDPGEGDTSRQRTLESIVANGQVHAVSLADEGSLTCDHLEVHFERAETGQTIPTRLAASGEVMAQDADKQTIWCNQLNVDFEPVGSSGQTSEASAEPVRIRARLRTMNAQGNVQARLQDGVRAFGDGLQTTGEQTIVLTGNDVLVVREQGALNGGTRLELNRLTMNADWPGPGQFIYYASPIVSDEPVRIARPMLDAIDPAANPVQTRATWMQSMHYDGQFNDGAGALKLTGDVQAESKRNPLEHNTLKSQSLTLQFANVAEEAAQAPPPADQQRGFNDLAHGKRDLKLFIAEGSAEIESHTWLTPDHSDVSRVFFISGPYVEYDDQTFEAKVNGEGTLLVRDERPDAEPQQQQQQQQQAQAAASQPFDAKGTTSFRWTDHLHMTRIDGPLYQIQMVGDVSAIHESLDKSRSWMRGEQLVANVERLAIAAAAAPRRDAAFDLGGAMELRKITGTGGIVINTPTREITTDTIDYDYATGVAALIANQGNTVFVKTTGNPHPIRAQSMSWNLREDKITVTNLRGTAPR